jgi:hypothetical protein
VVWFVPSTRRRVLFGGPPKPTGQRPVLPGTSDEAHLTSENPEEQKTSDPVVSFGAIEWLSRFLGIKIPARVSIIKLQTNRGQA